MERVELSRDVVNKLKSLLDEKRVFFTILDEESFRNVIPMYLGEVTEVKEGEALEVKGEDGELEAFPLGSSTLVLFRGKEFNEIAVANVSFETFKNFLTGEEGYEADESASVMAEEEEEEWEPE